MKHIKSLFIILLSGIACSAIAQNRTPQTEDNGTMHWTLLQENGFCGAEDTNGNVIVPLSDENEEIVYLCPRITGKPGSTTEVDVSPAFAGRKKGLWALYDFTGTSGWRFKTTIAQLPSVKHYQKNEAKLLKGEFKTVSEEIASNPSASGFYRRGWLNEQLQKYDDALSDYAQALKMEDCTALMAVQCINMSELCERLHQIKAEGRISIWSSILDIVPEVTGGVTKIASLFASPAVEVAGNAGANILDENVGSSKKKEKVWAECVDCKGAKTCRFCNGTGKDSHTKDGKCHYCKSRGICPTCKGRGGDYI